MAQFLKLSLSTLKDEPVPAKSIELAADSALDPEFISPEQVKIGPESRIVFHTAPRTPGADRIRQLRMHLRQAKEARDIKTVLITSPVAHDGKSTIALNLATALTEQGKKRVLLLEADLHHAPLTAQLGLAGGSNGLADCLERGLNSMSVLRRIEPLGWYLLPAGKAHRNPTDLLQTTKTYEGVLAELSAHFDWIVVDSPPVLALTDALFLRQHADATLLVVRADHTPREAVDDAVRLLGRQHILGVVLNGVEDLDRMYYKYGAGYYDSGKPAKNAAK